MKIVRGLLFLILFLFAHSLLAQNSGRPDTLAVGVTGNAPFVMDTALQTGISLEIWRELAQNQNIPYRLIFFEDVSHALDSLQSGKIDVVVGPIGITAERAENFRFTQPYFQSSLSIMSVQESPTLWRRIRPFFTKRFFIALAFFIFILAVVGTILWISERKSNPKQFPDKPAHDIANGMWCAISTMTTTGYGDIVPKTFWGRFTTSAWMIISLVFATSIIAGISSTITISTIQTSAIANAEQLAGKKIAVPGSTPAADFVLDNGGNIFNMDNLDEGYQMLLKNKVKGIVFGRAQLLYFKRQHPDSHLYVSKSEYNKLGYGFAFPLKRSDLNQMNIALLQMQESGEINKIIKRWLGKEGT